MVIEACICEQYDFVLTCFYIMLYQYILLLIYERKGSLWSLRGSLVKGDADRPKG